MGSSILAKILANPVEWLKAGRNRYGMRISAADLRSGKVQFVTVKAKSDTLAAHRTWEGMRYLQERLEEKGIHATALFPQLLMPNEGYVRGFYNAEGHKKFITLILSHLLGKATKKINTDGGEKEVPDVSFPQAGIISFVLAVRSDQKNELVQALRGEDGKCGLVGPTFPEEDVQKGKVKNLEEQRRSLRIHTSIDAGGDLARSRVLNGWHCSDGAVAAVREVAWIYGRRGLEGGVFSEDAIDYIMRGDAPESLLGRARNWLVRKTSDVILPTADILRFPIYDLLVDVAQGGRVSGATSLSAAARLIASFYDVNGYNPRDMQAPDLELMLKEAALFAAEQGILSEPEMQTLGVVPRRTNLTILVGASGIGKTTILEKLRERGSAAILKVKPTREGAGDAGSEEEKPDVFLGRALQGRYVAAEGNYGVDYAVLDRDIKEALLKGGPVVVSCGPEMAKILAERVEQFARELGLETRDENENPTALTPTVKVVYLQEENDAVLEEHLKTREAHTGRPAADRVKSAKDTAKYLREKLSPGGIDLPGVTRVVITRAQTEDQTLAQVEALLGEATVAPALTTIKVNSPRVELVLRKYLRDLVGVLQGATLDPTSADTREAGIGSAMREGFNNLLREIYRSEHGRNPILPHEDVKPDEKGKEDQIEEYRLLKWVTDHVHMALAAFREGMGQLEAAEQDGLPRFGALLGGDTERVERNLARVREVFASLPSMAMGDLLILLHDIGKMGLAGEGNLGPSWPHNHEKNSSALVDRLDLLKDFGEGVFKSEQNRTAFKLVLRHHHLIGNCYQGAASPRLFEELISDAEFAGVINGCATAKEAAAFVDKVLDWMLFFTIVDVAGQGETGFLSNLRLEYYFKTRDEVGSAIKQAIGKEAVKTDWETNAVHAVCSLAERETANRLAAVVSPLEGPGEMDKHAVGLRYYSGAWVEPSVAAAIADGYVSRTEWDTATEAMPQMVFPYFDGFLLGGNPVDRIADLQQAVALGRTQRPQVNGNLFKYYALCGQVVKALRTDKAVEFVMVDGSPKAHPTTGGAQKIDGATRETTDGQQAFIDELNMLFGLDGRGIGTAITSSGTRQIDLYQRDQKQGEAFVAEGPNGKIEFLVDEKAMALGTKGRITVYVKLPNLRLTMPEEKK